MAATNTNILLPAQLDVGQVQFGVPRVNDNGGKSIYLSFNRAPIVLQTPEMYAPFGLQRWDGERGTVKYTLDLSFKDMDDRPGLKTFFDKLNEFGDMLIDAGVTNQFEWLKKRGCSRDTIKELFTPPVRHPIDKNTGEINARYPPTFKLSVPFINGAFQCEVYDSKRKLIDLTSTETKGARVTAIIQCTGIWVAAGKFGCMWKAKLLKVVPVQALSGYAFLDVESDLPDDADDAPAPPTSRATNAMAALACEDDDDLDA